MLPSQMARRSQTGEKKKLTLKQKKKMERETKRKEVHGFSVDERAQQAVAGRGGWDAIASSGEQRH